MLQLVSYLGFPFRSVLSVAFTELLQCQSFVELKESHQNPVLGHLLLQLSPNSNLSPSSSGVSKWHSNCYPSTATAQVSAEPTQPEIPQYIEHIRHAGTRLLPGLPEMGEDPFLPVASQSLGTGRLVSAIPLTATIFLKGLS